MIESTMKYRFVFAIIRRVWLDIFYCMKYKYKLTNTRKIREDTIIYQITMDYECRP